MATEPLPVAEPEPVSIDCDQLTPNTVHVVYSDQQVKWFSGRGMGCVINFDETPFQNKQFHVPKGHGNSANSGNVKGLPKKYKYSIEYEDGTVVDPELDVQR